MLDPTYTPPPGFGPVLRCLDGRTHVPVAGLARLVGEDAYNTFDFDISEKVPALPLRAQGLLYHARREASSRWVVDADGQAWRNNVEGSALKPCSAEKLLSSAEDEADANAIRRALGLEIPMPGWARTALAHGWTPPEGWTWPT